MCSIPGHLIFFYFHIILSPPFQTVYPAVQPCAQGPLKGTPTCDPSQSLDKRVEDLLSRIPKSQVAGLFSDQQMAIPNLNLPFYNVWYDKKKQQCSHPAGIPRPGIRSWK